MAGYNGENPGVLKVLSQHWLDVMFISRRNVVD